MLGRPFCIKEILKAIELDKPIHLLIEQDSRFSPFPVKAWLAWEKDKRKTVMVFKHRDDQALRPSFRSRL